MAFSLLWSLGLAVSILIFGFAIGLNLSYMGISRKTLAGLSAGSVICTFALVYVISMFKNQLSSGLGAYSYLLLFLIAFMLMFVGYLINKDNGGKNFRVPGLAYLCFMLTVVICVGSGQSLFGLDSVKISAFTGILFGAVMAIAFFVCGKFNLFNASYKTLGSMYFIMGAYFLMVSLFLPNIIALNMDDMKPINVVSIESVAVTLGVLVAVVVLGLLYYKKNSLLK